MIVLIIGVPDSGKSNKAEEIVTSFSVSGSYYYIATMIPFGEDGRARVEKHRKARQNKGFTTVECPVDVASLTQTLPDLSQSVCLIECISNLVGNEMHRSDQIVSDAKEKDITEKIVSDVLTLAKSAKHTVIVSNEFPPQDPAYDDDTIGYVRLLSKVNARLTKEADRLFTLQEGEWIEHEDH